MYVCTEERSSKRSQKMYILKKLDFSFRDTKLFYFYFHELSKVFSYFLLCVLTGPGSSCHLYSQFQLTPSLVSSFSDCENYLIILSILIYLIYLLYLFILIYLHNPLFCELFPNCISQILMKRTVKL